MKNKLILISILFVIFSMNLLSNTYKIAYFKKDSTTITIDSFLQNPTNYIFQSDILIPRYSVYPLWIKITEFKTYKYLVIKNPFLDQIVYYKIKQNRIIDSIYSGDNLEFNTGRYLKYNLFNLKLDHTFDQLIIKIQTKGGFNIPIKLYKDFDLFTFFRNENLVIFSLFGIILFTFILNIVFFIRLKDKLYLLCNLSLLGFAVFNGMEYGLLFQYLWPAYPFINNYNSIFSVFNIFIFYFSFHFLDIKKNLPFSKYIFYVFYFFYLVLFLFNVFEYSILTSRIDFYLTSITPFLFIGLGLIIYIKSKERSVLFFLMAWILLTFLSVIYIFYKFNFIEGNFFVLNSVSFGTMVQVILLFIATLDKLAIYKEEKEQILKNQNTILHQKVIEQTKELIDKNEEIAIQNDELYEQKEELIIQKEELQLRLNQLRNSQEVLINTEKMASVGLLTAGIVHEINNPINFINAGIQALEEEIEHINKDFNSKSYKKIKEAIQKTKIKIAEVNQITSNLRSYSRFTDNKFIKYNISESIDNALLILHSTISTNITIHKNYEKNCEIECIPGKINQVFVTLISMVRDTILEKGEIAITISKDTVSSRLQISIKDNGKEFNEIVRKIIRSPKNTILDQSYTSELAFYIAKSIIEQHNGEIKLFSNSEVGKELIIEMPTFQ